MAELAAILATAILKVVGDQIGSAIGGQIKLQKDFDKDLENMKMSLESVDALLKDAEKRTITDKTTLLWLKRLSDAMYDISSIIDEFEADTQATTQSPERKLFLKKHLLRWVCCFSIGPKIRIANEMEMMRHKLKEITDNHKNFTFGDTTTFQLNVTNVRETSSLMNKEELVIGRKDETEKILACLSEGMETEFTVLPIYGIGGIGKSTLAKIVFSSSQFRGYSQVWIYVSETFDLKKIGNSIISQLSKEKSEETVLEMIQKSVRELLANNKILIVLDDLWENNQSNLDKLMNMLKIGESGNVVVIVTTRSESIAKKISSKPHKLATLTDDMCWTIIKQKSDFQSRGGPKELEQIGEDIARKCGGVALAAQSLGQMLYSLTFDQWELVRNNDIWNLPDSEDTSLNVLASLRLSYSAMPPGLKLCFAYCAIFPKGYKLVKDELIHQWISLGFIKATQLESTLQLCDKYISQLVGLSFVEQPKSSYTMEVDFENNTLFTMHDLVHDLARSVMVDEILVASKQGNTGGGCCHFALLNDCGKPLESPKIRALRFTECGEIELHGASFSSAKSLRVLDLSECSINKLPDSIGVLKQLRYLNAPRVQDTIIPDSITRLSKLIYLNLHGSTRISALPESIAEIEGLAYLDLSGCSGIEKLPESIGEIEGLAYLDLSGCSRIENLPKSFGRLQELVHLDFSHCSCVGGISALFESLTQLKYLNLSYCPEIGELPEALGGLSQLQYLNLSCSSYLEIYIEGKVFEAFTKLEYLNLSREFSGCYISPEALGRFIQLKYLNLSGCENIRKLPRLLGGTSLQYLNLGGTRVTALPDNLTKVSYLNLSFLQGDREDTFDSLINHICNNIYDLEYLDLSRNWHLQIIPESICNLRKLHTLDLSQCYNLRHVPASVQTIDSLKFLYLNGCRYISQPPQLGSGAISLPHFMVKPGYGDSGSNLVQLQSANTIELQISNLENVKSVAEAHRAKLVGKQKLEDLTLKWTRDAVRFVDEKILLENLVPPSTLKKLKICGYNGVSLPSWVVDQLPNLEELSLTHMESLQSLVLTDMANLKLVVLKDMESLEEWDTSYSSIEEPVIEELEIHDCPMLRMKPLPPKAKSLMISNSDNVLSSWEECKVSHTDASSSSSPIFTIKLSVADCKVPMHQWRLLQHLPGLSTLFITNCGDLTGSSETSRYLSNVETLQLNDEDMEELPKWLSEFTSLQDLDIRCRRIQSLDLSHYNNMASLKRLMIWDCDVLKSIPESIHQLTSLQYINIASCPELKHFPELEVGKMGVNHNQEKACLLPISLEELCIQYCEGIKSLPDGIEQLTNLQKLSIIASPKLKQWCKLEENHLKLTHIADKQISDEW